MFLNPVEENCDAIFLGIARLQGQFVRKAARLSTQRKEGREKLEAVKHARKYMSPNADGPDQLAIIQKGCALLAFDDPNTQIQPYRDWVH